VPPLLVLLALLRQLWEELEPQLEEERIPLEVKLALRRPTFQLD